MQENSQNTIDNEPDYTKSIEMALEVTKNEYSKEVNRAESITSRVNILFAIIIGFLTIFLAEINENVIFLIQLINNQTTDNSKVIFSFLLLLAIATSFVLLIISSILLFTIISPKKYFAVDYNELYTHITKGTFGMLSQQMKSYKTALDHNITVNDKKTKRYGISILLMGSSFFMIFICYILTNIFI